MFQSFLRPAVSSLLLATIPIATTTAILVSPRPGATATTTRILSTSSSSSSDGISTAVASLPPLLDSQGRALTTEDCVQQLRGKRVAYYLAAGWCPMCTRFEPSLVQFRQAVAQLEPGEGLQLIYVPSDRSADTALQRAEALDMWSVPFGSDADEIKKQFQIWAGPESLKLGMGRRSGVPALVVLNGETGQEMAFLPAEAQGVAALKAWPLDDPAGIW